MSVGTYRKKPVEIQAMQWDGTVEGADAIFDWVYNNGGMARYYPPRLHSEACRCDGLGIVPGPLGRSAPCPETEPTGEPYIAIDTLEGTQGVLLNDYVIRDVQGEFYVCKSEIFAATYE